MKGDKYVPCWCLLILVALIIVWTWWWTPDWANWAITVAAVLIALVSLSGKCCCSRVACCGKDDKEEETTPEQK